MFNYSKDCAFTFSDRESLCMYAFKHHAEERDKYGIDNKEK